nr:c-type cytochrome biogenesis protein CcsB [Propionibacterium sp.]
MPADIAQFTLWAATLFVALSAIAQVGLLVARRPTRVAEREYALAGGGSAPITPDAHAEEPARRPATRGLFFYGRVLAWLGLAFLTVSLIARAVATGHGPFTNQHEFAVSFAWGVLAAYAYFEWRHRMHALALIVMPVALALLAYALTVDPTINPLVPALQNRTLLTLHVLTAVLAYGAAGVAFAAAALYLVRPYLHWRGLPSAEVLDEIGYRSVVFSFPLMTIMIILGAIWADIAWGTYWSWDPKETAALVTWLIYGAYLHARVVRDLRGRGAAWLLILGFAAVVFTFFGNLFFGGLHAYA